MSCKNTHTKKHHYHVKESRDSMDWITMECCHCHHIVCAKASYFTRTKQIKPRRFIQAVGTNDD